MIDAELALILVGATFLIGWIIGYRMGDADAQNGRGPGREK